MIIRRLPEDFYVEEALTSATLEGVTQERSKSRPFILFQLQKTTLTTPEAVVRLAQTLRIKPNLIESAGLKDKHAVTSQYVSVRADGEPPEEVIAPAIIAKRIGYLPHHLRAQNILHNRFVIVVRDATIQQLREMGRRADLLHRDDAGAEAGVDQNRQGALAIINYFGEQRFNSARHGEGFIARKLMTGDFEGALKLSIGTPARKDSGVRRGLTRAAATHWGNWPEALAAAPKSPPRRALEILATGGSFQDAFVALPYMEQQMAVEAYQSHLWNATARRVALDIAPDETSRLQTTANADDDTALLFPTAAACSPYWLSIALPMFSAQTQLTPPWQSAAEQVLLEEEIKLEDLQIPGIRRPAFGEVARPLIALATGFDMSRPEPDELSNGGKRFKRTVEFCLPRGAYATVVLRALGQ